MTRNTATRMPSTQGGKESVFLSSMVLACRPSLTLRVLLRVLIFELFSGEEMPLDEGMTIVPVADLEVVEEIVAVLGEEFFGMVFVPAIAKVIEQRHGGEEPGGADDVREIGAVVRDAFGADDLAAILAAPITADDVADDLVGGAHVN